MKYCLMILYTATLFGTIALLIEFSIKVTQVCVLGMPLLAVALRAIVFPPPSSTTAVTPHFACCSATRLSLLGHCLLHSRILAQKCLLCHRHCRSTTDKWAFC